MHDKNADEKKMKIFVKEGTNYAVISSSDKYLTHKKAELAITFSSF